MNTAFRPQDMSKRWTIKMRRQGYDKSFVNSNFHTRVRWYPVGYKPNHLALSRIAGRLHYLASHSPKTVAIKYKVVYNNFMIQHGPGHKASFRYMNTWGSRVWL